VLSPSKTSRATDAKDSKLRARESSHTVGRHPSSRSADNDTEAALEPAVAADDERPPSRGFGRRTPHSGHRKGLLSSGMNMILLIVVLLLLFGGGGFYFGGPAIGGGGVGLILLVCLVIFFMGGFRAKS
jgi:hypothetical protein